MPAATLTVSEVARLFRFSPWSVYEGVKSGSFPVPHLKLGARRIVFPVGPVAEVLGISVPEVLDLVDVDRQAAAS